MPINDKHIVFIVLHKQLEPPSLLSVIHKEQWVYEGRFKYSLETGSSSIRVHRDCELEQPF